MWFLGKNKKSVRKEEKRMTLDEILKGIDELPEEDRAKVKDKMDDLYKAEDEREIDKIEENRAEDTKTEDDKKEDKDEETEEIAKDVDDVEKEIKTDEDEKSDADSEKEPHDDSSTPLEQIIRQAVAEEVKSAVAALMKPSEEEKHPSRVPEKDKSEIAKIEAIYS